MYGFILTKRGEGVANYKGGVDNRIGGGAWLTFSGDGVTAYLTDRIPHTYGRQHLS